MNNQFDFTDALKKVGALVEGAAKQKCPVDTGELRQSIKFEVISPTEVVIGTNKEYAPYVEYGTGLFAAAGNGRKDVPWSYQTPDGKWHSTVGQHPKPYLNPALDENRTLINSIIKEAIYAQLQNSISSQFE